MNILKKYLKEHNLTMEIMGYMLGVSKTTISHWSTRHSTPRPKMARKIEKVTKGKIAPSFWGYKADRRGKLFSVTTYTRRKRARLIDVRGAELPIEGKVL